MACVAPVCSSFALALAIPRVKAGVEVNETELACKILEINLPALPPEEPNVEHKIWLIGSVRVAVYILEPLVLAGTHVSGALGHIRRNRPAALLTVLDLERVLRWPSLVDVC